ncbi:GroES-like protein [Acephala macrosclerotiorum]|nr:GroES-like protein [Acephala macrosclerotiorum]
MVYPETFKGFQIKDPKKWTEFHLNEFQPKPFGDYDVDIKISACGVCASDLHTVSGGWGEQHFPLCVGHEIVGTAIRTSPKVTLVKVGQKIGVGAQSYSCLDYKQCKNDNETYCRKQLDTYGAVWPDTGIVSQGRYSSHMRTHEHWVFLIPDALPTIQAAPMLCAGLTAYSPLVRNGCGPGKKVGIVGLGGIDPLGAEVWVISRSHSKEADALKMGADGFIATQDKDWNEPHIMTFDLILNIASSTEGFDLERYLSMLDVHGRWVSSDILGNGCLIGASHLGSRKEVLGMLDLAVEKEVKSWVEEVQIGEEGLKDALTRLHKTDVKYRFTLTGYENVFGA